MSYRVNDYLRPIAMFSCDQYEDALTWAILNRANLMLLIGIATPPLLIYNDARNLLAVVTATCHNSATIWQTDRGWIHECYELDPVHTGDDSAPTWNIIPPM